MVLFTLFKSVNGHCICFVLSKFNSLYQFRKLHWLFYVKASKKQLLRLFFLHTAYISLPMESSKFHSRKSFLCLLSREQSLLDSNWHISSNIEWSDILVSWFRIVAYSTAISPPFLIHFRIYSTQDVFSSGQERSRKEIRNCWEAFFWSNKWKIIKNFVAIGYFQFFKTAHFLFKVTILQFLSPTFHEASSKFPL